MFQIEGTRSFGGVERITLGKRVWGALPIPVHCYRVGSTLVDAGPPKGVASLLHLVDADRLEHLVLTHHHEDHVGAAAHLAERGVRVHAPKRSLDALRDPPEIHGYRRRTWGTPEPVDAEPVGEVLETPDVRLEVHEAPGHSPDHVVYHAPEEGWLFAGDAYLAPRDTLRADEELEGFLESLEAMRAIGAERLFPGHGSAEDDPRAAITGVLEHYGSLADETRELLAEGREGAGLRRRLLGLEGFMRYYTGGHFSKQNLADELVTLVD